MYISMASINNDEVVLINVKLIIVDGQSWSATGEINTIAPGLLIIHILCDGIIPE